MIQIAAIDHLVLTVADVSRTCEFYQTVLGMAAVTFGDDRQALRYGQQKINLHQASAPFAPHAQRPTPGSADLCFLITGSLEAALDHLQTCGVPVVAGPVPRTGATGKLRSIYIRDPDGNLIELSVLAAT
ncbi:VOC family protein [Phormidium tenue]|uniref:VOC family protein n=1 Tax=Phormidium tenue TaxID=126344 RepID=UPI001558500E|nr:VOC family protein [Phormidium tenue]MBD2231920.1 VOC family protein [Phormidium tenue FACHB-1052]